MVHQNPLRAPQPGSDNTVRLTAGTGKTRAAKDGQAATVAAPVAHEDSGKTMPFSLTELKSAVQKIESSVAEVRRTLLFTVDEESGDPVITVVDRETQEVIRRIPQDEMISVIERFGHGNPHLLRIKT